MKNFELRIGNQTAYAAKSALEPFEFALSNGFRAFEFFPDRGPSGDGGWDERAMGLFEREFIRKAAVTCGLALTVHAPLAMSPLKQDQDGRVESVVEFARELDAKVLVVHLDLSQGLEAFGDGLSPLLKATRKAKLKLALENTVWNGPEELNAFFAWLRINHPQSLHHTGLCFDLGHANVCSATQNDYLAFIDRLALDIPILHLHLHENWGDRDSHLTLFTGPSRDNESGIAGLLQRLKSRSFRGCAILEQWPQPPELLVETKNRLEALMQVAS